MDDAMTQRPPPPPGALVPVRVRSKSYTETQRPPPLGALVPVRVRSKSYSTEPAVNNVRAATPSALFIESALVLSFHMEMTTVALIDTQVRWDLTHLTSRVRILENQVEQIKNDMETIRKDLSILMEKSMEQVGSENVEQTRNELRKAPRRLPLHNSAVSPSLVVESLKDENLDEDPEEHDDEE